MRHAYAALAVAAPLFAATLAPAQTTPQTRNVYHIGNSVTDTINYGGLGALAQSRGDTYTHGRHMIPGAPLEWIYYRGIDGNGDGVTGDYSGFRDPRKPGTTADTNPGYDWALPSLEWDAVTLQPFDRPLYGTDTRGTATPADDRPNGDVQIAQNLINLTRQNPSNSDTLFYVYSRWPRRDKDPNSPAPNVGPERWLPIDYDARFLTPHTAGGGGREERQGHFKQMVGDLRRDNPAIASQIRMVPVGDVLLELDKRIAAGRIPGVTGDINAIYADGIHFSNLGMFIVGSTFYATLFGEDPTGMAVPSQYRGYVKNTQNRELKDAQGNVISRHTWETWDGNFDFPGMTDDPRFPNLTEESIRAIQGSIWGVVSTHEYAGVPEPASAAMLLGAAGMLAMRRR